MTVRSLSVGVFSAALFVATGALGQAPRLLVSGEDMLVIIDTDGNGPDSNDCQFTAFLDSIQMNPPSAMGRIVGMQENMPLLRACQLIFEASGGKGTGPGSNFVFANITGAMGPPGFKMPGSLPFFAELVDETSMPDINAPVMLDSAADFANVGGARGLLCADNGSPAAQVRLPGGPTLLVDLGLFPDAMKPMFLKVPGLPLQLASGGFQMFNGFVPVTRNGHITVASSAAPSMLLVDINLFDLPPCPAGQGAPTLGETGLILLSMVLLALGTFALSRRDRFAQSVCF